MKRKKLEDQIADIDSRRLANQAELKQSEAKIEQNVVSAYISGDSSQAFDVGTRVLAGALRW